MRPYQWPINYKELREIFCLNSIILLLQKLNKLKKLFWISRLYVESETQFFTFSVALSQLETSYQPEPGISIKFTKKQNKKQNY